MTLDTPRNDAYLTDGITNLRGFREEDGPHLATWWDNARVTEYLEMGARPTRKKDLDSYLATAVQSDDSVCFAICEASTGKIIGTCGLYLISWISRRAQFNILIGDVEAWDKGHGSRAARLTLAYGFNTLNLNSINLGVNTEIKRAMKSYENAGYVKEGIRRSFIFRNGRYYDVALYSVLKDEFAAMRNDKP
ncbi:MAG: GNAT family protein [Alphaproteobacteria bacterium]|nr:GNAT family protein [Alphaproteobacteria bacterium]